MRQNDETRAAEHEAAARKHYQDRQESFERCDTDGFVSQWASGLLGNLEQRKAELARAGDKAEFPGLFRRSDGARVRAKLIEGRFGLCWAFCDADNRFTGRFLANSKGTPRSKLFREGFEVLQELAPARAELVGRGTGLSGTAWVATLRTDGGFPADAVEV